jgi:hypothetical protein
MNDISPECAIRLFRWSLTCLLIGFLTGYTFF